MAKPKGKRLLKRLLISLPKAEDERAIRKAAQLDSLPMATWIRQAAVLAARAKLASVAGGESKP